MLHGRAGADELHGGGGTDTLTGGTGADGLFGGDDADRFVFNSASEGGDWIGDFCGSSGSGDVVDLTALMLGGGGQSAADLIAGGYLALLNGTELWADLDGSDGIDGNGGSDDFLIAGFADGGAGFNLNTDVLV